MAADNKLLGQFDLVGIPPAARGMPQIEVTFDIDANGIVSVSAKDKATAKEQQIRIQASGGLSDEDIQRMVKEAEVHASEDKLRREKVEITNQAEAAIHTAEKGLEEHGDKLEDAQKTAITEAIAALKEVNQGDDLDSIKSKTQALVTASMALGEAMYKASQEAQGAAHETKEGGAEPEGPIVDAEFEDLSKKD